MLQNNIVKCLIFCCFFVFSSDLSADLFSFTQAPPRDSIQDFFKFNEKLSRAVCDASVVNRPPTLAATPDTPLRQSVNSISFLYEAEMEIEEHHVLSLLMENPKTLFSLPQLRALWEEMKKKSPQKGTAEKLQLSEFKKRISLEVCTATVRPSKLERLIEKKPFLFFSLKELSKEKKYTFARRPVKKGVAKLRLRDVELRYGKILNKWWATGWVEPYEVYAISYGKRHYRRLANPITNRTQMIHIVSSDNIPLAYFYPSPEESPLDMTRLLEEREKKIHLSKKIESYRSLIEHEAFQYLTSHPQKSDQVRKLQEFYKSLLKAYELYPEDQQFQSYRKLAKAKKTKITEILDPSFFSSLKKAQSAGVAVRIGLFRPDERLQAIFLEYLKRLHKI